jgi:hypothetical protein
MECRREIRTWPMSRRESLDIRSLNSMIFPLDFKFAEKFNQAFLRFLKHIVNHNRGRRVFMILDKVRYPAKR